jgi:hypothetical protein
MSPPQSWQAVEQEGAHPLDVAGERVLRAGSGLVRTTEADQVGCDRPQAGCGQDRDHVPVEEAPGRLTVEQQHGLAVAGALVQIVHAQFPAVLVGDVGVVGREPEVGQTFEALVRGAENLHRGSPLVSSCRRVVVSSCRRRAPTPSSTEARVY